MEYYVAIKKKALKEYLRNGKTTFPLNTKNVLNFISCIQDPHFNLSR